MLENIGMVNFLTQKSAEVLSSFDGNDISPLHIGLTFHFIFL